MDGWIGELVRRGVDQPYALRLVAEHGEHQVAAAVAYFDRLGNDAGPGILVLAIREGRAPRARPTAVLDRQAAFGEEIVTWLRQHFPQWNHEGGNRTHTAAIASVIRLRHQHGWPLSMREHGPEIRAAVARFEAEYGSPGGEG